MKNFIVLGSGTAGLFTALFVKNLFPNDNITIIRSKDVGIIGVGEATTPNVISFLQNLNIDILDLIKNCDITIKNGISFDNWNGDNKKYFHAFDEKVLEFSVSNIFDYGCNDFFLKKLIKDKLSFDEYLFAPKLSYENKVNFDKINWAIHFNTNKLSEYLEKIAEKRNIKIIDGNYKNVIQDENGFIKKIVLEDDREFEVTFVFDCSGFHRVLIGNLYNEKWVSYSKHLPMKRAIPFWLESENDKIRPYTTCTAMKYGWIWNIPLQSRIGSGYVFDSDYINEDQALKEAEEFYGRKLEIRKIIDFNAGKFENYWVKNCMAVGLASSFIEPLESTSLFLTVMQLSTFKQFLNELENPSECGVKLYNKLVSINMEDTMNFVYLHYMTKRKDSIFWEEFREKNEMPDKLKSMFDNLKSGNVRFYDFSFQPFQMISFIQVANGLEIFDEEINIKNYENINPSPLEYKKIIDDLIQKSVSHKTFIENLTK